MGFIAEILGFDKPKKEDLPPPVEVDQGSVENRERRRLISSQQPTIFTSGRGLLSQSTTTGKRLLGE